jgi:hypothetical protein
MTSGRYVGLVKCRIIREKPQYRTQHETFFVTLNIHDFEMRNSEVKPSKSKVTGNTTIGRYVGLAKSRIIRE